MRKGLKDRDRSRKGVKDRYVGRKGLENRNRENKVSENDRDRGGETVYRTEIEQAKCRAATKTASRKPNEDCMIRCMISQGIIIMRYNIISNQYI